MSASPKKYWRLAPNQSTDGSVGSSLIEPMLPADFVKAIGAKQGVVLAAWGPRLQLGNVVGLGVVRMASRGGQDAQVDWVAADLNLRPSPSGRRWWTQEKPYFSFANDVVERYMLDDIVAEHFPEFEGMDFGGPPPVRDKVSRPSSSPRGGYVYVIRSKLGFKIGKTIHLKQRTRLFAVKLPFQNSLEHYAWFDDYTHAERSFHLQYHAKRLEGEWFDLNDADLKDIKKVGLQVPVDGLQ